MRLPILRTLSARIVLGFAVLILTFGTTTVLTVAYMDQLGREIRVIRTGYLQLALKSGDLAEKQRALHAFLKDELKEAASTNLVQRRIKQFRTSREQLLRATEAVVDGFAGLPERHARRLEQTHDALGEIRRAIEGQDGTYEILLKAPPIERLLGQPTPQVDPEVVNAALAALDKLRNAETQILSRANNLAQQQANIVERIAHSLERNEAKLRTYTLYIGLTAICIGLLVTLWATITLRPLRRLRDAARGIASGDYGSRIDEAGPTEVGDLAREFNVMGRAIEERERELVRSERLVAVGKMAAMITHEVRNPLSSIGLNVELLDEELGDLPPERSVEARSLLRAITAEVDRLTAVTEEYLKFARLPKPKLAAEALDPIVRNLADFQRVELASRGVALELELAGDLPPALVDEAQVRQVLLNLVRNAADALEPGGGGSVTVGTRRAGDAVEIIVSDDGPGIAGEVVPKLFDPFFSTKEGGTGLGLALTRQIVREHGGEIRVESLPGRGASFVVSLPLAPAGLPGRGGGVGAGAGAGAGGTGIGSVSAAGAAAGPAENPRQDE
jgi:two-component system, NtrC family, sensor kinase